MRNPAETAPIEARGQPLIDAEATGTAVAEPMRTSATRSRLLLGFSLVLIAFNLRLIFSSLSVLLPEIIRATGLTSGSASLITTLPVLCMGLFAGFAPGLGHRFGTERTILGLVAVLTLGTGLRALGTVPALMGGATLAGASIAVINVLLPGLVKRDFPDRLGLMTGLFTTALSAGAALAAAFTVPIEHLMGGSWAGALGIWAAVPALAFLLWLPQALPIAPARHAAPVNRPSLWRSPLAWQVSLFMGLQSTLAYIVFGYLAPLLRERGMEPSTAGIVVSLSVLSQCAAALTLPAIAVRRPNQSLINAGGFALAVMAFLGCMFAPLGTVWFWGILQGLGQGGLIALAMTMIVLRSPDAAVAARLSSMAQGIGYTLAATGPLLAGLVRGATGSYAAVAALVVGFGALGAFFSFGAGRAVQIKH